MEENIKIAIELLKRHEGYKRFIYKCPAGKPTVGYGLNLEATGVTKSQASYLLTDTIKDYPRLLRKIIKNFYSLSSVRQAVLIDMVYNLGFSGLSKFKNMIKAIEENDFYLASNEMLSSKWAKQVGDRAHELSRIMANDLI